MTPTPAVLACALLVCLAVPAAAHATDAPPPLAGAAYRIAEQAYAAHARGDHERARDYAREAVRLRPDLPQLRTLLAETERAAAAVPAAAPAMPGARRAAMAGTSTGAVDWNTRLHRLQAAGAWTQAWQVVEQALRVRPDDADLRARRGVIARQLADDALRRAWAATGGGAADVATAATDEALRFAPDLTAAHLLRIRQQLDLGDVDAAIDAAQRATAQAGQDPASWLLLGALLQQRDGDMSRARQAWRDGLQQVPPATAARLRIALADAALVDGDLQQARQWLQRGESAADAALQPALAERDRLVEAIASGGVAPALVASLPAERVVIACGEDRFGIYCGLPSPALPSYRLVEQAQRQMAADPVVALALLDGAAMIAADGAAPRCQADALRADLAYRALAAGDAPGALALIADLDAAGALPDTMLADAAYASLRVDARTRAAGYFHRSLDAADAGTLPLAPQPRFGIRRALSELERDRGFIASASYRGDSRLAGLGGTRLPGDALQLGWEGYLRPQALQRQGRYLELHARLTGNAWSQDGAVTGGDSLQAAFGVRARPLRSQNLVLAVERLQHVGDAAIDDWLLRAAWSHSRGTDLRMDVPAWWSGQLYLEAGRYLDHGWTYAIGEGQAGRTWRLGQTTLLTPHLAMVVEHNEAFARADAAGAGPGLGVRRWFREDAHHAPRSWIELSAQYRLRLAGDPRAEGWFIRATLGY